VYTPCFTHRFELDVEVVEHLEEVAHRSGDSVRSPDQYDLEPATTSFAKKIVETRTLGLGAGDAVGVLGHDLEATLLSHRPEVVELRLRMLIDARDAEIERDGLGCYRCS
jgi:hypothetical protein